jgi:hypothetical protein
VRAETDDGGTADLLGGGGHLCDIDSREETNHS